MDQSGHTLTLTDAEIKLIWELIDTSQLTGGPLIDAAYGIRSKIRGLAALEKALLKLKEGAEEPAEAPELVAAEA